MPANYNEYLLSEGWNGIRQKVLLRDNYNCTECGRTDSLTVHHKTYEHIFHEEDFLEDLVTLCKGCHFKSHEMEPHPLFGDYVRLPNKNRIFTKVFIDPGFSKSSFYKCWFKILMHLEYNTNIVYQRKPCVSICRSKQELVKLTDSSRTTFYKFYLEASEKRCIAEFVLDNERLFIVNPLYGLNGYRIPEILFALFTDPLVYERKDGE